MKILDLFSGVGGFSLGLDRAGFKTVAFCEIDKDCQKVLKKHWPEIPIFDDVTRLKGSQLGNIDLICGGFPCQDISVAGKGEGLNGSRSGLWKEFHRIIKEVSPKWVIIENVANLRSKGLNQVLKDLWSLGYDSEWYVIPASAVGAPHKRGRIWIIAYPNGNAIRIQPRRSSGKDRKKTIQLGEDCGNASYSHSDRCEPKLPLQTGDKRESLSTNNNSQESSYSDSPRLQGYIQQELRKLSRLEKNHTEFGGRVVCTWGAFRDFYRQALRVSDGVSSRLDKNRIKQMGNAVVPQIPEIIGTAIKQYEITAEIRRSKK